MKKALLGAGAIIAAAILGILLLSGEKRAESAVVTTDIIVDGMSCQGCVDKVNATLSELKGVKAVEVRLKDGVAHVKYNAALVTVPAMEQSITKLGYSIGKTGASALEKKHDCEEGAADGCCAAKSSRTKT